jgi:predicted MFS family arabinose efflux permease
MKKLKKVLLLCDTFFLLSGALLAPIYAIFVDKIGGDILDASFTSALFMLTAGIVIYGMAHWEDRDKHQRKFVIAGYGLSMIGYAGYLFVDSALSLFAVQVILGLAVALKDPAYDALFSESDKHLALSWGEWESMDYIVYGLGALAGGMIAKTYGFDTLLSIMFGFSVLAFILSLHLLKLRAKNL